MKLSLLISAGVMVSASVAFADPWHRHHRGGGTYMPLPPVVRQWRYEEHWWRYQAPRPVPYCAPEQGPPNYDQFGNLVSCGPTPRW